MDPWSAVQCASAVVGFIDLAGRLVVGTYKTYTGASELKAKAEELENVRQRLRALGDGAKSDNNRSKSKAHTEFHELCEKCEDAINSMLTIINKVCEVEETNPSLWSSLKENVGKLWSTKDVGELQKQLEGYQQQLRALMIEMIRSEHEASTGVILETHQVVQRIGEKVDQLGTFGASYHDKDRFADYLLDHLLYREMDDRSDAIYPAHKDTASWIFEYTSNKLNFVQWLGHSNTGPDSDSDIFWITGKPGSGKSTLMKHIIAAPETSECLGKWAGERPLLVLSSYFWTSGGEKQRNKAGFLRRLLYQAVDQHRDFAAEVFQEKLRSYRIFGPYLPRNDSPSESPWSDLELERLIRRLVGTACKTMNVAIFIDGLDEYGGNTNDIISLLDGISRPSGTNEANKRLKLCVSSRPWPAFQSRFSCKPSVKMEERNGPDIKHYVTSTLRRHPRWGNLNRERAEKLNGDIAEMAEGVFLWAYLVTGLLTDALNNGDGLEDLQRLLYSLPLELTELFERILGSLQVNQEGFRKASELLQVILVTEDMSLSTLGVFYALLDPEEIYGLPVRPLSESQLAEEIDQAKWMVSARTKCLLEVVHVGSDRIYLEFDVHRVQFIHRTVGDYLKQPTVRESLQHAIKPTDKHPQTFNPHERLALAQLALLKIYIPAGSSFRFQKKRQWLLDGVGHITRAYPGDSLTDKDVRIRFLREITATMESREFDWLFKQCEHHPVQLSPPCRHSKCQEKAFPLNVATRFGLDDFFRASVNQVPLSCRKAWLIHEFSIMIVRDRVLSARPAQDKQLLLGLYLHSHEGEIKWEDPLAAKKRYRSWQMEERLRQNKNVLERGLDWIRASLTFSSR